MSDEHSRPMTSATNYNGSSPKASDSPPVRGMVTVNKRAAPPEAALLAMSAGPVAVDLSRQEGPRLRPINEVASEARRSSGTRARALDPVGVLPPVLAALLAAKDPEMKETAWGAFVRAYTPLLLRLAHRLGRTYDGAMDRYSYVLEHLYCDDFRRLRVFAAAGPARFSTWLVVIARRLVLDYHRELYGRNRVPVAEGGAETRESSVMRRHLAEMVAEDVPLSAIRDWSMPHPEAATYAAERNGALQAAVSSLEPRDQLLVRLRFDKELGAREIADLMGFPTQFHVYRRLRVVLAVLCRRVPPAYREYVAGTE